MIYTSVGSQDKDKTDFEKGYGKGYIAALDEHDARWERELQEAREEGYKEGYRQGLGENCAAQILDNGDW